MKKLIVIVTMLAMSSAFAGSRLKNMPKEVAGILKQEIISTQELVNELDGSEGEEAWLLSRIRLMIYPLIKFDLWFLEFKVAPVVELRWGKRHPGYTTYNPDRGLE